MLNLKYPPGDNNFDYSNRLHQAAERWGLETYKELIALPKVYQGFGRTDNPYQQHIQIQEVLSKNTSKYHDSKVTLFTVNGRWGYALSVNQDKPPGESSYSMGCSYSPNVISKDFSTRNDALLAACFEIDRYKHPKVQAWIEELRQTIRQPSLF